MARSPALQTAPAASFKFRKLLMGSKFTSAVRPLKSAISPELTLRPPSELDAAAQLAIPTGQPSSGLSEQELLLCLSATIAQLQCLVLSGDVWWLAKFGAGKRVAHLISPEKYEEFWRALAAARQMRREGNPISSMFSNEQTEA